MYESQFSVNFVKFEKFKLEFKKTSRMYESQFSVTLEFCIVGASLAFRSPRSSPWVRSRLRLRERSPRRMGPLAGPSLQTTLGSRKTSEESR